LALITSLSLVFSGLAIFGVPDQEKSKEVKCIYSEVNMDNWILEYPNLITNLQSFCQDYQFF
jgi:hypothetical protein